VTASDGNPSTTLDGAHNLALYRPEIHAEHFFGEFDRTLGARAVISHSELQGTHVQFSASGASEGRFGAMAGLNVRY
jgi:hypothetical protein